MKEYQKFKCGCEVKLYGIPEMGIGLMYKHKCNIKGLQHRDMIIRKLRRCY